MSETVTFRVSAAEAVALDARASEVGVSRSELLRSALVAVRAGRTVLGKYLLGGELSPAEEAAATAELRDAEQAKAPAAGEVPN
jgi:hypothetical protein